MGLISLTLRRRIFKFALAVVSVIGLLSLTSPALAQMSAGTTAKTISVAGVTLNDGDDVFLDIDGFQWTVGTLDNNKALVAIPGASDGPNARLTIEIVDAATRTIRLKYGSLYIGRASYWRAFPERKLSYYAVGVAPHHGYGDFVVGVSSDNKRITLKESGAWISRFCCVSGSSATNAIVASFHGQQGGTGASIGVRLAGTLGATRPFADGTRINLIADNGFRMSRCNGCQDTLNNSLPDTIVLTSSDENQVNTFTLINDAATGKVMLQADNGKKLTYCYGCITGGALYPEQLVLELSDSNYAYNKFELTELPNRQFTLKAHNGKFLARCDGCSPSLMVRTNRPNANVVMAHVSDPSATVAQWTISIAGLPPDLDMKIARAKTAFELAVRAAVERRITTIDAPQLPGNLIGLNADLCAGCHVNGMAIIREWFVTNYDNAGGKEGRLLFWNQRTGYWRLPFTFSMGTSLNEKSPFPANMDASGDYLAVATGYSGLVKFFRVTDPAVKGGVAELARLELRVGGMVENVGLAYEPELRRYLLFSGERFWLSNGNNEADLSRGTGWMEISALTGGPIPSGEAGTPLRRIGPNLFAIVSLGFEYKTEPYSLVLSYVTLASGDDGIMRVERYPGSRKHTLKDPGEAGGAPSFRWGGTVRVRPVADNSFEVNLLAAPKRFDASGDFYEW